MSTNHILDTEECLSDSSRYALKDAACKVIESMLDGTCGELPFGTSLSKPSDVKNNIETCTDFAAALICILNGSSVQDEDTVPTRIRIDCYDAIKAGIVEAIDRNYTIISLD